MLCDGSIFKDLKGATKEQQGSNMIRTWYGDGTEKTQMQFDNLFYLLIKIYSKISQIHPIKIIFVTYNYGFKLEKMILPQNNKLPITALSGIFNNASATNKFNFISLQ